MDDVFGGADSQSLAAHLKSQLIAVGKLTTAVMNQLKCRGPSQNLGILGHQYNSVSRRVELPILKQEKYLAKLRLVLSLILVSSKDIESLVGYLG